MLIPRFSIRWLLGLTTFSAGVSLILSYAVRGQAWAIGITAGLWSLVTAALLYVGAFLLAWWIAQVVAARPTSWEKLGGDSPFAALPPAKLPAAAPAQVHAQSGADNPPPMTG